MHFKELNAADFEDSLRSMRGNGRFKICKQLSVNLFRKTDAFPFKVVKMSLQEAIKPSA